MTVDIRAIVRNASYLAIAPVISMALTFVSSIIIIRSISVTEYGVFAFIVAYCTTLTALTSFRTSEAVSRYVVCDTNQPQNLSPSVISFSIFIQLITRCSSYLAIFIVTPIIIQAELFNPDDRIAHLAPLLGISLLLEFFEPVWNGVATVQKRFAAISLVSLCRDVSRFIVILYLWLTNDITLHNIIFAYIYASAITFILNIFMLASPLKSTAVYVACNWSAFRRNLKYQLSPMWRFMRHGYFANIASTSIKHGDILILSAFRTADDVGIYRLAKSLATLLQSLVTSLSKVIFPEFITQVKSSKLTQIHTFTNLLTKRIGVILSGVFFLAIIAAKPLIPLIYGQDYNDSFPIFVVLVVGTAVTAILFWVHPLALSLERTDLILKINILNVICFYTIGLSLTDIYGAYAIAGALSFSWAFGYLFLYNCLRHQLKSLSRAN